MRILLSNDDGVHATGIKTLAKVLSEIAELDIITPDRDRSGASNSLTLKDPLRPRKLDNGFVCIEGTPTDCVHLALTGFLDINPDMVISGINEGANLGDDVLYSGTVAAAMEGRILGLPSIAVSLVERQGLNYQTAAAVAKHLVEQITKD
ncbi:MAG: 5'/3'-nucleotidase SurE, partial [Gammaproteobacteria bacterium]|nr:5'/3'-nucleotidase SurE [Gammaproteobacteria bacterium]